MNNDVLKQVQRDSVVVYKSFVNNLLIYSQVVKVVTEITTKTHFCDSKNPKDQTMIHQFIISYGRLLLSKKPVH